MCKQFILTLYSALFDCSKWCHVLKCPHVILLPDTLAEESTQTALSSAVPLSQPDRDSKNFPTFKFRLNMIFL